MLSKYIYIKNLKKVHFVLSAVGGESSERTSKKGKRLKSVVWAYFSKVANDDEKAECNLCLESFKRSNNTSNLFKVFLIL